MQKLAKQTRFENIQILLKKFKQKINQNGIILPPFVKIVEVGPRDGLQNEPKILQTSEKIRLINSLSQTGLKVVECTSFVSPKWVPQMSDNIEVYKGINKISKLSYPCLVPNIKGLDQAIEVGVKEIAIFGAASETFTKKNINCTIQESIQRFKEVTEKAKLNNIKFRGYVSTVLGCPYQGDVNPQIVAEVSKSLYDLGCYEISLGDTIGIGTPEKTQKMLQEVKKVIPVNQLAAHFHDTYDKAIENIFIALENNISVIDTSIAGLGGCPYAKTQAGNVCTENVVYCLNELGVQTGVDLDKIIKIGQDITQLLGRENMCFL